MLVPSLEEGARLVNSYAPEHLSLITEREGDILPMIRTAGAIFLGNHSPVAVGDFLAGPSHTLPTGGAGQILPRADDGHVSAAHEHHPAGQGELREVRACGARLRRRGGAGRARGVCGGADALTSRAPQRCMAAARMTEPRLYSCHERQTG